MNEFGPLRELLPVVRPKAADELAYRWVVRYQTPRQAEQAARIWRDHVASVADYWAHKRRHPDSHAGLMVILYRWTPYVLGTASVLTVNPIGLLAPAFAPKRSRRAD